MYLTLNSEETWLTMKCFFASMPSQLCFCFSVCVTSAPVSKEQKMHLAVTASTLRRKRLVLGLKADGKCAQVYLFVKCLEAVKDPLHRKSS